MEQLTLPCLTCANDAWYVVLGVVADSNGVTLAEDEMPYTAVVYGNGPGHTGLSEGEAGRQNLTNVNTCESSSLQDRLVGLMVKASASRAEDPGFESRLRRDFFGVESYQ